jgi:predicted amidophosphoribosyltransferase
MGDRCESCGQTVPLTDGLCDECYAEIDSHGGGSCRCCGDLTDSPASAYCETCVMDECPACW